MKRFVLSIAVALSAIFSANAQEYLAFEEGVNVIKAGVGLSSYVNPSFAISAGYERGFYTFGETFTIGAEAAINVAPSSTTTFEISLGPTFHYSPNERFDVYAGPTIYYYGAGGASFVGFLAQAGVRYYFGEHFGVYANIGGIGLGSVGVAVKF